MKKYKVKKEAPIVAPVQPKKKRSIWNELTRDSDLASSKTNNKPRFQFPEVIDSDGSIVRADEIMNRYMQDNSIMMDGITPQLMSLNQFQFNQVNNLLIDNVFMGWSELAILTQNGILNGVCKTFAGDMTNQWIEFVGTDDEVDKDKIKELELEFERLNVREVVKWALYIMFSQGGCQLYPKLKGDEEHGEKEEPLPLDSMKISKGDLEYLTVIEPIWAVPIRYVTDNPFSKWFYKPEYYTVMGHIVHESRFCKFIYNEAPNLVKPMYMFYGMPLMQQMLPKVSNFQNNLNAAGQILQRLNISVLKTNMESIIDDSSLNTVETAASNLKNRINIFNNLRNNMGTFVLDKEDEEFEQLNMTIAGVREIVSQSAEFMSIIPKMPSTKMLGTSPQGFNATGEFEMNNYYDLISSMQNDTMRANLIKIMHLAMLNIWGEIDDKITFQFKKLEESNKLEDSVIRLNNTKSDVLNVQSMVLDPQDVQTRLAADPESGYDALEIEEKKLANSLQEKDVKNERLSSTGLSQEF